MAAVLILHLWEADLHVPFAYGDDSLLVALPVKSITDHGWYLTNPNLGAPNGLELHDYPFVAGDTVHLLTIKLMALFSGDWALLFNVYFLMGFPLITLAAMTVFRHFGVGYGPAIAGGVLYSFLPSRLSIGEAHLYLNVFYQVPLAIMVVMWVCGDDSPVAAVPEPKRLPAFELVRTRSRVAVGVCLLTASTGLYYAFFVVCLLVAGGICASIERRSLRNALAGAALAAVILNGLALSFLPTAVYRWRHGPNPEVGVRNSGEAEIFGMKVSQLLLPIDGHRVPALKRLKERYRAYAPLVNENSAASLGIVGSLGFLVLLGVPFLRPRLRGRPEESLQPLAILNLAALLLATVGGFGSMIALLITPQIRTYTRMSVLIGFFSLFAVVILLDQLRRRRPRLGIGVTAALLVIGLLDQTSALATPPYEGLNSIYRSDDLLVRQIEARLPTGAIVFQLPYVSFPEAPGRSYDWLRGYLHSRSLRWSLPTMRGRSGDKWAKDVAGREPPEMLRALLAADVRGILIDRIAYPDRGAQLEATLADLLGTKPLHSAAGDFAFVALPARPPTSDASSERRQQLALHPMVVRWTKGCYGSENHGSASIRWCGATGELHVDNEAAIARAVSLKMTATAAWPPARLTIDGDMMHATVDLTGPATSFARTVQVTPGHHVIKLRCDGRRLEDPGEPRALVWRVENPTLEDVQSP